jgi:hypothetical protein
MSIDAHLNFLSENGREAKIIFFQNNRFLLNIKITYHNEQLHLMNYLQHNHNYDHVH